jgi:hypothetical protein
MRSCSMSREAHRSQLEILFEFALDKHMCVTYTIQVATLG